MHHEHSLSKDTRIETACEGKFPYLTFDAAAEQRRRRRRKRHMRQNIYRCRFCRHWHIGGVVLK